MIDKLKIKMKCIPSDQGTGTHETALCEICYNDTVNITYAREMASQTDDINPDSNFVDCSENGALSCCICGINIYGDK